MKILFISHVWPPAVDGGSQIVFHTQKQLKKLGHQTLALTTNCQSTDDFIIPKSKIINLKSSDVIRLSVYKSKLFIYLKKFFSKFLKIENWKLLNLLSIGPIFKPLPFIKTIVKIRNFKPDLIIAGPFPTTISLYSLFFKKIYKSKLLVLPCFHHQDDSFQNPILFNVLKKSDFIWCLSSFEKIYLSKKLDISKNKFFISPPGLSITPLKKIIKKPVNSINLLFLGNFAAHKRIEVLLTAFNIICQQKDNLHLTIAGQKTLYYPQIEKTIKNLPKKTRTNLTVVAQKYNQKILTNLLDKSHIFINPSINESYGIVFAESAARGVPVIGSDIPTVKNLITSNRIGLCFAQNNPIDLAKLILKLTKDKSLYSKLSQNCLSYSRKLSWPAIISKLNEKIA